MPWRPGESGNPKGRKRDSVISKGRARIARHLNAVIDQLLQQALSGDTAAAKLLLERCVPPQRDDYADLERRLTMLEAHDEPRD